MLTKFISGQKSVTYPELVKKIQCKAPHLGSRLGFMLGIATKSDIKELRQICKQPTPFMSMERMYKILYEVPQDMEIDGKNPYKLLVKEMPLIKNEILVEVGKSNDYILSAISVRPLGKNKSDIDHFSRALKIWNLNPVKIEQIQRVERELPSWELECDQLREGFNTAMNTTSQIETLMENATILFNSVCDNFEGGDDSDKSHCIPDLVYAVFELSKLYSHLSQNLACLKEILTEYNEKRYSWARFLIGMREPLNYAPKPILKRKLSAKQLAKQFAAAAFGRTKK